MKRVFRKLNELITGSNLPKVDVSQLNARELIRRESQIGGQLFGPVAEGHRREFFCLDERTWIWHEEWIDPETKQRHILTTRYEIRDDGVLKVQDNQPYQKVEGEELNNLVAAIQLYYERVVRDIYHHDPATGKPLAKK